MTRYAAGWRYCTSCQVTRPDEGKWFLTNGTRRWKCATCLRATAAWRAAHKARARASAPSANKPQTSLIGP